MHIPLCGQIKVQLCDITQIYRRWLLLSPGYVAILFRMILLILFALKMLLYSNNTYAYKHAYICIYDNVCTHNKLYVYIFIA